MKKLKNHFYTHFVMKKQKLPKKNTTDPKKFNIFFENKKFENCFTDVTMLRKNGNTEIYNAMHILEGFPYTIKKVKLEIDTRKHLTSNKIFKEVA